MGSEEDKKQPGVYEFTEFFRKYHNDPEFKKSFDNHMDNLLEQWRKEDD